ncbi:hypothetical protein A0U87_21810 [Sphingobium sp. MP9-4]|uniref:family 43 glycosylhydrolase n=1 Tax=Sphingobium sp. MP9-4 TaxID=1761936 RepID=UPI001134DC4D|nr:family 43 glycosylhydrolase [Sphingobium sp. MP9-4]TKV41335.1 hypothetical protein A0U87_21810 [Sphingobium sp. MP9-4]
MIWADRIEGPWSAPIDLKIDGCIDPGHVVGEDGRRYLFTDGIRKIRLSDDWSFHPPAADEAARALWRQAAATDGSGHVAGRLRAVDLHRRGSIL